MTSYNPPRFSGPHQHRRPPPAVTPAEVLEDWDDAVVDDDAVIDGPVVVCPVCTGVVDHLSLARDLEGLEPACCHDCGALLAA